MTDTGQSKPLDAEKELRRAKHDCLRWLKGFHNVQRSELFMKRFAEKANSRDHHTKEALFQAVIVSYAKPFTQTETGEGKGKLPTRSLKVNPCFKVGTHEHIMELRNKLIAHDDLTAIEPRYVWISLVDSSDPHGVFAPFQAYLRNSCLSYPQDRGDFDRMHTHIRAARDGAMAHLDQRVIKTRELILSHPKKARLVFQERPDSTLGTITGDGNTTDFKMDLSAVEMHPVIAMDTLYKPASFGNYRHTTVNVQISFNGPQGVELGGSSVSIISS